MYVKTLAFMSNRHDQAFALQGDVGVMRSKMQPGPEGLKYSRGIRQKVYRLSQEQGWRDKHKIYIGPSSDIVGNYSEQLARSRFCLVAPGSGICLALIE